MGCEGTERYTDTRIVKIIRVEKSAIESHGPLNNGKVIVESGQWYNDFIAFASHSEEFVVDDEDWKAINGVFQDDPTMQRYLQKEAAKAYRWLPLLPRCGRERVWGN